MDEQGQNNDNCAPPGRIRVGVAYNIKKNIIANLPDAEAEFDDPNTIQAIKNALEESGYEVELLEANGQFPASVAQCKPDIVFNIAEGFSGRGREAHIPAILNFIGIPFTGSDETTMCVTMDKPLAKKILSIHRVTTPKYKVFGSADKISVRGLKFPLIVKPTAEGSGKGISSQSVVYDLAGLKSALSKSIENYCQIMLVEEYISGREFTVGILGNGRDVRVFPPMEIIFRENSGSIAHNIYSYEIKSRFEDYVDYKCPPDLSDGAQAELMRIARRVYDILECRDFARIDFRMDGLGKFYFIELNPLPGLAPGYSDFPILAGLCGLSYKDLINQILTSAMIRYGISKA